ncbi:hypothetical protein HK099_006579 [Clydaea vesicula]|uniref:Uncharacterized protein n=1 Tax=Clydaea vesicula TaxID=447962 RepID=A0AAD5U034_9FUNG|nr:hypothetical protein HK099_006579 [Clydaea vesicula]
MLLTFYHCILSIQIQNRHPCCILQEVKSAEDTISDGLVVYDAMLLEEMEEEISLVNGVNCVLGRATVFLLKIIRITSDKNYNSGDVIFIPKYANDIIKNEFKILETTLSRLEKSGSSGMNIGSIREYKQRADIFTMFSLVRSEKPERLGHRLPIVRLLYKILKCNIFILSYRRYGFSEGEPNETALDYIKNHEILKNTKLIAYGQSVGGAVAIDVVSKNENLFEALIIENILFLFFTSPSFERRDFYCYEDGFISTERDFDFTTCFEESVLTPVISFYFTCSFIYFKFSLKQERTQFTPRRPPSYYIEAKGTLLGGYLDLYKDSSKNVSFELPPCSSSSGRTVLSKFMDEDQGYYSDGDDLDGKPNKYQD